MTHLSIHVPLPHPRIKTCLLLACLLSSLLWQMQQMAQQLTDAGLPVPPEDNMEELYQTAFQACIDEKTKATASKQAQPAGSPTGHSV